MKPKGGFESDLLLCPPLGLHTMQWNGVGQAYPRRSLTWGFLIYNLRTLICPDVSGNDPSKWFSLPFKTVCKGQMLTRARFVRWQADGL